MSGVLWEVLILVLLIVLNGVFAMSEIAVVSSRRAKLRERADVGDRGAQAALDLAQSPQRFLATVQIGITLIGILAGAFGGATLAEEIARYIARFPALARYAEAIAVVVVVLAITYASLVVGELVPKRLGLAQAERIAALIAPSMNRLSRLASPLVDLLDASTSLVVRWLPFRTDAARNVTEQEVRLMIREGTQVGVFEPGEQAMIDGVFRFHDLTVDALMTPRPDVVWVDSEEDDDIALGKIASSGHTDLPVARGDLDHVVGLVAAKDLLGGLLSGQRIDLRSLLRAPLYVPESMTAAALLDRFRESRDHMALVIDEFGGCQGLVTLDDVFAAIVGDLPTGSTREEPAALRRDDGSWLADGRLQVERLREIVGVTELPAGEGDDFLTLGGLVMTLAGRLPAAGDRLGWRGWRYEVVDMDGRRVDKVLISREDVGTDGA